MTRMGDERKVDENGNALGDRFKKAPTLSYADHLSLKPAEARAEAERRLHEAWIAETARHAPKADAAAPRPSEPALDPRLDILGDRWEAISDDPKWVEPQLPDWTHTQPDSAPQADPWKMPAEPAPAKEFAAREAAFAALQHAAAAAPQFVAETADPAPVFPPAAKPQDAWADLPQVVAQPASEWAAQAAPPVVAQPASQWEPQAAPQVAAPPAASHWDTQAATQEAPQPAAREYA